MAFLVGLTLSDDHVSLFISHGYDAFGQGYLKLIARIESLLVKLIVDDELALCILWYNYSLGS